MKKFVLMFLWATGLGCFVASCGGDEEDSSEPERSPIEVTMSNVSSYGVTVDFRSYQDSYFGQQRCTYGVMIDSVPNMSMDRAMRVEYTSNLKLDNSYNWTFDDLFPDKTYYVCPFVEAGGMQTIYGDVKSFKTASLDWESLAKINYIKKVDDYEYEVSYTVDMARVPPYASIYYEYIHLYCDKYDNYCRDDEYVWLNEPNGVFYINTWHYGGVKNSRIFCCNIHIEYESYKSKYNHYFPANDPIVEN